MLLTPSQQEQFRNDPARFITAAVRDYVVSSPGNRFSAFPEEILWEEPLVGFADGDDPLFQDYKRIIGDFHVTPREALEKYLKSGGLGRKDLSRVSVISWILPITEKTRAGMRNETTICTLRWNHTRFEGQDFNYRLERYVVSLLESLGILAVAPDLSKWFDMVELPNGKSSRWSQRHVAYAAGLGTFGLNDGFISPKGIAVRIGSVVCNLALPASPRPYADHQANCLFYRRGICGKCIRRCPAGAVSSHGHDKIKCFDYLREMREVLRSTGRLEGYIGTDIVGCGFCQTGVPCEHCIPDAPDSRN